MTCNFWSGSRMFRQLFCLAILASLLASGGLCAAQPAGQGELGSLPFSFENLSGTDFEAAFLTLLFVALAIAVPLCGLMINRVQAKPYLSVGAISLCTGVWIFAQTGMRNFIVPQPAVWNYSAMLAVYLLPAGLASFAACTIGYSEKNTLLLLFFEKVHTYFAVASLFVVATGLLPMAITLNLFYVLLAITMGLLFYGSAKAISVGNTSAMIFILGLALVFLTATAALANGRVGFTIPLRYLIHWGILIFIGGLTAIARFSSGKDETGYLPAVAQPANISVSQPPAEGINCIYAADVSIPSLRERKSTPGKPCAAPKDVPPVVSDKPDTAPLSQQGELSSSGMENLVEKIREFAHEVSTPLGSGLLAASHLEQEVKKMNILFKQDHLRKSDLEQHIVNYQQTAEIILTNLKQAADLTKGLQANSKDSEEKQTFNLNDFISKIVLGLSPQIQQAGHEMHVLCDNKLVIHSYPMAIHQILTNLIMNSLIHAYGPGEKGNLIIDIYYENGYVEMRYKDNGKGIEREVLQQIFTPHFTTNRQNGSTGLGLAIVRNIEVNKLGGTIECDSAPGAGTTFMIRFPAERG